MSNDYVKCIYVYSNSQLEQKKVLIRLAVKNGTTGSLSGLVSTIMCIIDYHIKNNLKRYKDIV